MNKTRFGGNVTQSINIINGQTKLKATMWVDGVERVSENATESMDNEMLERGLLWKELN